MNEELLEKWIDDICSKEQEPPPPPKFPNIGNPKLVGLSDTEWWFLFEQIRDLKCLCTDAGYHQRNYVWMDKPNEIIEERWWEGTVITPGGDHYRVLSVDGEREVFEIHQFKRIEKING